ncbi:MAG: PH domain-containing protein [Erysipelotrichia bacterium]|nr:PH domain-containing protein [Erysipelotrichia bacterium]
MPINFNQNSSFSLKQIDVASVKNEVKDLLIDSEEAVMAFQTVRDQLIFTDKRIISVDVQGFIGAKKTFCSMPYSNIQYFAVQTAGFGELKPDNKLILTFSNSFTAEFNFKDKVDIGLIGRTISKYLLK